jgi:hypothetical protein
VGDASLHPGLRVLRASALKFGFLARTEISPYIARALMGTLWGKVEILKRKDEISNA